MSDAREVPFNGRVAHVSLEGQVAAERFVEGVERRVARPVCDLLAAPDGRRERQLTFGEGFLVLEEAGGFAFGRALRDGFVGWIAEEALWAPETAATHRVSARLTNALGAPDFKAPGVELLLPHGAEVAVLATEGGWSRVLAPEGVLWIPARHLAPLGEAEADPVTVAELFLGVPYVWGGNSALGIDCSGLVQAGCRACHVPCPGDSDQQEAQLGRSLPPDEPLRRGDLLFWAGHVAWVADPATLLHANAHHMAVAFEPVEDAIARIAAQGDGPVTARKRIG